MNLYRSLKILSYNISIAPKRAKNILEMALPYDLFIARAENVVEITLQYDITIVPQRSKNFVEITNISIPLQRAENIVEITLPYDISIFLPYLYCPTTARGHRRNDHSVRSLYCPTMGREHHRNDPHIYSPTAVREHCRK